MSEIQFPTGKPHVSYSEINEWAQCSYRHKLHQINKIELGKPSPHLGFGTAVHAACEVYINTKVMDVEIASKIIREYWENNSISEPVESWIETANFLLSDFTVFLDQQFPGWTAVSAEEPLYEEIENHEIKFKGFIDVIIKAPNKRGKEIIWILDIKTSNFGWRREKRDDFMTKAQIILYKSFWTKKHNIDMKETRCAFIILKKNGKPGNRIDFFPVSVGEITSKRSLKIVDNMVSSVKRGIALKNRDSCRYCDYFETEHCK